MAVLRYLLLIVTATGFVYVIRQLYTHDKDWRVYCASIILALNFIYLAANAPEGTGRLFRLETLEVVGVLVAIVGAFEVLTLLIGEGSSGCVGLVGRDGRKWRNEGTVPRLRRGHNHSVEGLTRPRRRVTLAYGDQPPDVAVALSCA